MDELAAEYEGRVLIGKCDVEENDEITMKYGVRNIPTIVFLKGGELVDKQVGARVEGRTRGEDRKTALKCSAVPTGMGCRPSSSRKATIRPC